jgi:hypothetical protein
MGKCCMGAAEAWFLDGLSETVVLAWVFRSVIR